MLRLPTDMVMNTALYLNANSVEFLYTQENQKEKNETCNINYGGHGINISSPNIQTLRLIEFDKYSNDRAVIESCNLHNSLKNLVLHLKLHDINTSNVQLTWRNVIQAVLKKEYYYNLEQV